MDWPESTEPIITVFPRGLKHDGGRIGPIDVQLPASWRLRAMSRCPSGRRTRASASTTPNIAPRSISPRAALFFRTHNRPQCHLDGPFEIRSFLWCTGEDVRPRTHRSFRQCDRQFQKDRAAFLALRAFRPKARPGHGRGRRPKRHLERDVRQRSRRATPPTVRLTGPARRGSPFAPGYFEPHCPSRCEAAKLSACDTAHIVRNVD
jgi:hypothetical protein